MKKRLAAMLSVVLLTGCGGLHESSEAGEIPEQTYDVTSASTTTATFVPSDAPVSEHSGQLSGGVVLTDEHRELRRLVSGASEFCDFEELGLKLTVNKGVSAQAMKMCGTGYANSYTEPIGYDDGFFYFAVTASASEHVEAEDGTVDWIFNFTDYYFSFDCSSGELTQIYSPYEGYEIHSISNEAMLLRSGSSYKLVHRDSGNAVELAEDISDAVLVNDIVYYVQRQAELYDERGDAYFSYELFWHLISESDDSLYAAAVPTVQDQFWPTRGVRNVVFSRSEFMYSDLSGNIYIAYDPQLRIHDFVTDTYYQCTAMTERNISGWRTRLSMTDRNGKETFLGYLQTEERPRFSVTLDIHATRDGIIFLKLPDSQPIILVGEYNDFTDMKAAFLPEDILPDSYEVYCSDEMLFFYGTNGEGKDLITLSKE